MERLGNSRPMTPVFFVSSEKGNRTARGREVLQSCCYLMALLSNPRNGRRRSSRRPAIFRMIGAFPHSHQSGPYCRRLGAEIANQSFVLRDKGAVAEGRVQSDINELRAWFRTPPSIICTIGK